MYLKNARKKEKYTLNSNFLAKTLIIYINTHRKENIMKKKYNCEVDCANCANRMEDAVKKIDGVIDANVNFMTQKFTLEADDDKFDSVLKEAVKTMKKVEPDFEIEL